MYVGTVTAPTGQDMDPPTNPLPELLQPVTLQGHGCDQGPHPVLLTAVECQDLAPDIRNVTSSCGPMQGGWRDTKPSSPLGVGCWAGGHWHKRKLYSHPFKVVLIRKIKKLTFP